MRLNFPSVRTLSGYLLQHFSRPNDVALVELFTSNDMIRKMLFGLATLAAIVAYIGYGSRVDEAILPRREATTIPSLNDQSTSMPSSNSVAATSPPMRGNIEKGRNTPGANVKRLSLTGNPNDAMRAYQIVASCLTAESTLRTMALLPLSSRREIYGDNYKKFAQQAEDDIQISCGEIDSQLLQRRFENLAVAAKAGVTGAAVAVLLEGPFGDPTASESRPDDPLVKNWKNQTLELLLSSAKAGELSNFEILSNIYQNGVLGEKDPGLALTYQLAANESLRLSGLNPGSNRQALVPFLSRSLTKDEIDRANADAKALVEK
ncbi:MAG: hypothetical protein WCH44_02480 [Betaproteobacteria bacterium]